MRPERRNARIIPSCDRGAVGHAHRTDLYEREGPAAPAYSALPKESACLGFPASEKDGNYHYGPKADKASKGYADVKRALQGSLGRRHRSTSNIVMDANAVPAIRQPGRSSDQLDYTFGGVGDRVVPWEQATPAAGMSVAMKMRH